jgi:ATP-dependent Lon protease
MPRPNEKNVNEDLTDELRRDMTIHYVQTVDEVLLLALTPSPKSPGDRRTSRRIPPPIQ